ncbi:MAG: DUF3426 domain-containing protein [Methylotenera sp.]|nr:DUF3426 domain-containing protein [Methylotenera sp.]
MRAITRCPNCQTQFFVTDVQLNKHDGKVRCGQCLHIFNAKTQFITPEPPIEAVPSQVNSNLPPAAHEVTTEITISTNKEASGWPAIDNDFLENDSAEQKPSASTATHTAQAALNNTSIEPQTSIPDIGNTPSNDQAEILRLNNITQLTSIANNSANYFADLAEGKKRKAAYSRRWIWRIGSLLLLLLVTAQCLYFLRDSIALHYPNTKPLLERMCVQLSCSINLPQQIDLLEINDSDMLEDPNIEGLIRLSSTLINHAPFNQAYPNLELTLTDTEGNPSLRKIFKPNEYLPSNSHIPLGLEANAEVKIKLGISTQGEKVAGYRILVTY